MNRTALDKVVDNERRTIRRSPPIKRFKAREKLLDAAYAVMGRRGLDACTIGDIIAEAGVGVGSFYKHFTSKEDLAKAVFISRTEKFAKEITDITLATTDPVVASCFAYRSLIDQGERDAVWASFIVNLEPSIQMLDELLRKQAKIGMTKIVKSSRLNISNIDFIISVAVAIIIAVIKSRLRGEVSSKEAHGAAVYVLRMLGISESDAKEVAAWPMAKLQKAAGH